MDLLFLNFFKKCSINYLILPSPGMVSSTPSPPPTGPRGRNHSGLLGGGAGWAAERTGLVTVLRFHWTSELPDPCGLPGMRVWRSSARLWYGGVGRPAPPPRLWAVVRPDRVTRPEAGAAPCEGTW